MKQILIIPDIHGRKFWRNPVQKHLNDPDTHIVFLGDYLDPYRDIDNITAEKAFEEFKELIKTVKNSNNVTLLIGNHDYHYFGNLVQFGGCRKDTERRYDIATIFSDNKSLFKIAFEYDKYLFTHAGVILDWFNLFCIDQPLNSETLNSLIDKSHVLMQVSYERGGYSRDGSCIWADVYEHMFQKDIGYYQIFAHSYQYTTKQPIIQPNFAMLDCAKAFVLNLETGDIVEFDDKNLEN